MIGLTIASGVLLNLNILRENIPLMFSLTILNQCIRKQNVQCNYQAVRCDFLKTGIIEDDFCSFVESSDVKDAWSKWIQMVEEAMKQAIPCVKVKENGSAPWFDCEIRHLHNGKMTDWRRKKAQLNRRTNSYLKRYADNRKQLLNLYEVNL